LFQLAANDGVPSRTGRYAVIGSKLKQNANEGCNSCASVAGLVLSFIACFILLLVAPLVVVDGVGRKNLVLARLLSFLTESWG